MNDLPANDVQSYMRRRGTSRGVLPGLLLATTGEGIPQCPPLPRTRYTPCTVGAMAHLLNAITPCAKYYTRYDFPKNSHVERYFMWSGILQSTKYVHLDRCELEQSTSTFGKDLRLRLCAPHCRHELGLADNLFSLAIITLSATLRHLPTSVWPLIYTPCEVWELELPLLSSFVLALTRLDVAPF